MIELTADQNKIVDAAFKIFAKHGPNKTTMAFIAKELGYTRTFLYYYFPDKESIYKACIVRGATKLFDGMKKEMQKNISGAKMMENTLKLKVECAKDFQKLGTFTEVDFYKILRKDPELQYIFAIEPKLLIQMIQIGVKDKSIGKCNPTKTALNLMHGLHGYMSIGLKNLEYSGNLNPQGLEQLFKSQIEYGKFLMKSLTNCK